MTLKKNDFQTIGQFFTEKNVLEHDIFNEWWALIPPSLKTVILEPFAGKNGLIDMLGGVVSDAGGYQSYDILPGRSDVEFRDTLEDFPTGYGICITNPPFLAKNSATRKNLSNVIEPYADLYELCLYKCLSNCPYVAIIIPESFLTTPHFKNNLFGVVSLTHKKIFKNTEQPVCLALFVPNQTQDFKLYKNSEYLGTYNELKKIDEQFCKTQSLKYSVDFHRLNGQVGFMSTDATNSLKPLKMVQGFEIEDKDVNPYARLRTRLLINKIINKRLHSEPFKIKNTKKFIHDFNTYLSEYRLKTHDVFLTSFKGLRDDGCYRRRISYTKLRELLLAFLEKV